LPEPLKINEPVIVASPVWLNCPIFVKVLLPDTVSDPVIVVLPNEPVSIEEPPPDPNPLAAADDDINVEDINDDVVAKLDDNTVIEDVCELVTNDPVSPLVIIVPDPETSIDPDMVKSPSIIIEPNELVKFNEPVGPAGPTAPAVPCGPVNTSTV
jgi:hypothetical protein